MMQLSVSTLHKDAAIKRFRDQLERYDFDIHRWRESAVNLKTAHVGALDATNEAGWNLAAAMLKPRKIERCENGNVKFIHNGSSLRLSAVEALKHSFFKKVRYTFTLSVVVRHNAGNICGNEISPKSI